MFENLTSKLEGIFNKLKKAPSLNEAQVETGLKEIRQALLAADVSLPVVKKFIEDIKPKAIGQEIIRSTSPGQMLVKIVHDELIKLLGEKNEEINLKAVPPASILLVGLQGSGKTTTSVKLAKNIEKNFKKKILLVSLDIYRPAAQEQLKILCEKNNLNVLPTVNGQLPVDIAKRAKNAAQLSGTDVIIFDTAGRTQIDLNMMSEIKNIKSEVRPVETILVADSLTGQIAVNLASEFDKAVELSSIILTRVDGDGRGGAALSMRQSTGKPIKFIGVGEKIDDLEIFHPERLAKRILGMGDIVSLVEKASENIDQQEAEILAKKMAKGNFDLEDFAKQLKQMGKMGGVSGIMSMLPGISKAQKLMAENKISDDMIKHQIAIINSMTKKEKSNPDLIKASRKIRISKGSGTRVQDVNKLLKQFLQSQKMMKKMKSMGKGGLPSDFMNKLQGKLPPNLN